MKFKGDIIITDPCYVVKDGDWDKCHYGDNMQALGLKTYLKSGTEYGDWSCTTFKEVPEAQEALGELNENYAKLWNNQNRDKELAKKLSEERDAIIKKHDAILGSFCADAGLVGVFLLEEVLAYNPEFDWWESRPWTTTIIKDFDGDVTIGHRAVKYFDEETGEIEEDTEVSVMGKGNVDFYTTQTGF